MTSRTIPMSPRPSDTMPPPVRQQLRQAALRRNLRTAAVLGVAASGAALSTPWLAATAGGTFLALTIWRYQQLRKPFPMPGDKS